MAEIKDCRAKDWERTWRGQLVLSWAARQDQTVAKPVLTDVCLAGFKRRVMEMVTFLEAICSSVLLSFYYGSVF